MGARGSSGGTALAGTKFPNVQEPIDLDNFPALTGSQKQINWANSIREHVVEQLVNQMYIKENGARTDAPSYIASKADMKKWVQSTKEAFANTNKSVLDEKVKSSVIALTTASDQVAKLKSLIAQETSARFWIDNRNTHPADPNWKKLRKKIIGY